MQRCLRLLWTINIALMKICFKIKILKISYNIRYQWLIFKDPVDYRLKKLFLFLVV